MAVHANTVETYDNSSIREDLRDQYSMISPEETPFQRMIGTGPKPRATYHEWTTVDLAAPDLSNRVVEGDDAPDVDTATLSVRRGNYTQISDKVVSVSHTNEEVEAAAENIQRMAKQMALKIRELKREMEQMLLQNIAANAGASGTARVSAGLPAFLFTNTIATAGGADPTLSDGDAGYPNTAATVGTAPAAFVESDFLDLIQTTWEAGGNPTVAMVNATNKRIVSETFTGSSTRYKDVVDRTIVNAVDVYDSDFGELTIVPNRFQPALNAPTNTSFAVYLLDPDFIQLCWLQTLRQKPLAETGHSFKRLLWGEYTLAVLNEASQGIIRDTDQVMA